MLCILITQKILKSHLLALCPKSKLSLSRLLRVQGKCRHSFSMLALHFQQHQRLLPLVSVSLCCKCCATHTKRSRSRSRSRFKNVFNVVQIIKDFFFSLTCQIGRRCKVVIMSSSPDTAQVNDQEHQNQYHHTRYGYGYFTSFG